ncbi:MAG: BrnA antitoxin family protein [Methylophilaceae bacterium]|nr:BrnA antitoxin family protein [Methylophilaceae bacterium]
MKVAELLPHTKKQITLRIDVEVLDFFKHTGKRYQSRMNAVLRTYVEAQKSRAQ